MEGRDCALVLGGGGVVGIAWETGVIAGLADHGVDLRTADLIIGTSAGATVAAQIAAPVTLASLYDAQCDPDGSREPVIEFDMAALREQILTILASEPPLQARQQIGALALAADRVPEAERLAIIAARLPRPEWPAQQVRLTAIDAESGELVAFDRSSGVALVDAVAASCAIPVVWPAVTIGGRRYVDGGMRSAINADLAQGYRHIVVLEPAPFPECADVEPLADEADVVVIGPDEASVAAMGSSPLDPTARPACARAGYAQGAALATELGRHWI